MLINTAVWLSLRYLYPFFACFLTFLSQPLNATYTHITTSFLLSMQLFFWGGVVLIKWTHFSHVTILVVVLTKGACSVFHCNKKTVVGHRHSNNGIVKYWNVVLDCHKIFVCLWVCECMCVCICVQSDVHSVYILASSPPLLYGVLCNVTQYSISTSRGAMGS